MTRGKRGNDVNAVNPAPKMMQSQASPNEANPSHSQAIKKNTRRKGQPLPAPCPPDRCGACNVELAADDRLVKCEISQGGFTFCAQGSIPTGMTIY